jgi:hypothetical protein
MNPTIAVGAMGSRHYRLGRMGAKKRNGTDDTSVLKVMSSILSLTDTHAAPMVLECSGKTGILAAKPSDPSQGSKAT